MKKRICIIIGVILVLFLVLILLPDSFYKKHSKYGWFYENNFIGEPDNSSVLDGWDLSIDDLFDKLLKNKYSYNYNLQNKNYTYICNGKKNGEDDNGSCSSPKKIDYNINNFKEVFKNINTNYLDISFIYDLVKDIDGESIQENDSSRRYEYNIVNNNVKTDIYIFTNKSNIRKIMIMNDSLTYIIEYSNIEE